MTSINSSPTNHHELRIADAHLGHSGQLRICFDPSAMFAATRRWFRRNRTPIAVGVGVVGAGYVVTQYVLSKINDARERMSSERIAKEK